jgi:hypothetical protein
VELSQKEFALLRALAAAPTRVFTKEELLRDVWGFRSMGATRTLDSHACRLRQKLGTAGDKFVVNVWGVGYRLVDGRRGGGGGLSGSALRRLGSRPRCGRPARLRAGARVALARHASWCRRGPRAARPVVRGAAGLHGIDERRRDRPRAPRRGARAR